MSTPTTRISAAALGIKSYFTGKPCPHGHIAERYTSNGTCIACIPERNKKQYHKNPKKHIARSAAFIREHPGRYRETRKDGWLRRTYGISAEQYMEMAAAQGDVCALCDRKETIKDGYHLSIDHCHQTGRIRGLLCFTCNTALGKLEKHGVTPEKISIYLSKAMLLERERENPASKP